MLGVYELRAMSVEISTNCCQILPAGYSGCIQHGALVPLRHFSPAQLLSESAYSASSGARLSSQFVNQGGDNNPDAE
jgi:hypothetical protein